MLHSRYGFNGQEKDDEHSKGKYDFGARIYDSKIAKFISVDELHEEAPGWTPNRFSFNNPLRFIDPDGNFEIDEATAAAYPKSDAYLKNLSSTYKNKPRAFKRAFKEYSQLSNKQIKAMLEYKKVPNGTPVVPNQANPRIKVKTLSGSNGVTKHRLRSHNIATGEMKLYNTGIIELDKALVENYEKTLKEGGEISNVEAKAGEILLESTLFHEGTHYGDVLDGSMDKTSIEYKPTAVKKYVIGDLFEGGKDFEKKVYGDDLGNGGSIENRQKGAEKYVKDNDVDGAASDDEPYFDSYVDPLLL